MKKITLITLISIFFSFNTYAIAEVKCKDLPGFKTAGKDTGEYVKCLADKVKKNPKFKLNTESKLKLWIRKFRNK